MTYYKSLVSLEILANNLDVNYLEVHNVHNVNITGYYATGNLNLYCISIDEKLIFIKLM